MKMKFEKGILYPVIILSFLGIVAIADVSSPQALAQFNDKFYFLKQQAMWLGIGFVSMIVASFINVKFWKKIATPFFFISLILLVLVLIPGFSYHALGARRWINLPFISFQPSEIIKLSLILYFAKLTENSKKSASYFLPLLVIIGLIMIQPDLGSALSVSTIALSQIFVSGISLVKFFVAGAIGASGVALLVITSPYRRDRLTTFLGGIEDPLGKGYHIKQILLALGSGGLFGIGIGASHQKYLFLPEASTDSIFAVVAEEIGFIGSVLVILIFGWFILSGFKVALRLKDKFSQSLAIGITAWIGGQAFLNIASMVAFIPLTGVPLPFFSYGGTSLVMILTGCGILLNISKSVVNKKEIHVKKRR